MEFCSYIMKGKASRLEVHSVSSLMKKIEEERSKIISNYVQEIKN